MVPSYNGVPIDSMFTARDPAIHKSLKTPVASLFAMSNMRNYEPYVDECTQLFADAMRDLEGQTVDLAVWLQWYAFDVVAGLTFQRRFGFLEQRKDVNDMIGQLDAGLDSVRVLGQYPVLDSPAKWLLQHVLPLLGRYSPLVKFVEVSCWNVVVHHDSGCFSLTFSDVRRRDHSLRRLGEDRQADGFLVAAPSKGGEAGCGQSTGQCPR
jgi:hypothetical protein